MTFFETNLKALENFSYVSQSVGARADYVQGGGGNTSVKLENNLMAIKASGYCLSDIKPDKAYAVLDYGMLREFYYSHQPQDFADVEKSGTDYTKSAIRQIEGLAALRPSVEAGFHSILSTYVAHSHSVYANLATCSKECKTIAEKALANSDYSWGFVKYTNPGINLTFSIRDELNRVRSEKGKAPAVIFMENHGVIVHHDDPSECLRIHDDVNEKLAAAFGITARSFPEVKLSLTCDNMYEADVPYLSERIREGGYSQEDFIDEALYPDQLVFLAGTFYLSEDERDPEPNTCLASMKTGKVKFNMPEAKALTAAQTLTAVLFIKEHIAKAGYTLSTMGDAAKEFIANWESEKYRKTLDANKK
jgi:ribulose-5-phosphate 4-epimerase/fuculose-1-phosphate aldolase